MAGIAETLGQPKRKGGTKPLVPQYLAAMDDDLRPKAEQLLDSDLSDRQVAEAFTDSGYPCKWAAIDTHRRNNGLGRHRKAES